jgi:hypothetical protein
MGVLPLHRRTGITMRMPLLRLLLSLCLSLVCAIGLPTAGFAKDPETSPTDPAPKVAAATPARSTAKAKGEISFDDLVFNIEKGGTYEPGMLTDAIRALDGKKVKLRGFILPSTLFRETNIDEFVLVRDNQECCFGPGAALYDCVVVNLVDGVTTDFTTRPVTVSGTFKLKEYKYPDGTGHFAIFNLQGTDVR